MAANGVTIIKSKLGLEELQKAMKLLVQNEVLVGFPDDGTYRRMDTGEVDKKGNPVISVEGADITNAALGYIHDNGSPEANIPARPFMIPGIKAVEPGTLRKLSGCMRAVLNGTAGAVIVEQTFHAVGMEAQLSIKNTIAAGVPPPLADSTLRTRARKNKNRKGPGLELLSRSMGYAPSMDFVTPLVDTGQLRNAVNYVIRSKSKRRK